MQTECRADLLAFEWVERRGIVAPFDGAPLQPTRKLLN
jgi:hypothetical protein